MQLDNITVVQLLGALIIIGQGVGYFNKAFKVKHEYLTLLDISQTNQAEIKEIKDSNEELKTAMKEVLKYQLKDAHKEIMCRDTITSEEFDSFKNQYEAYDGVGGNGTGTRWYNDVKTIPIQD